MFYSEKFQIYNFLLSFAHLIVQSFFSSARNCSRGFSMSAVRAGEVKTCRNRAIISRYVSGPSTVILAACP